MDKATIDRLVRKTNFTEQQIKNYVAKAKANTTDETQIIACIYEAHYFDLDIDILTYL